VKALSLRQPWADLAVCGQKTLELRTWQVAYRGPLAIHASKTVHLEACQALDMDPRKRTTGALIGTVDLVDIIQVDAETYQARQSEHLAAGFINMPENGQPLFGWILANPRRLEKPQPAVGHMGLFNAEVSDSRVDVVTTSDQVQYEPVTADNEPSQVAELDSRRPFELRLTPETDSSQPGRLGYRLGIYQRSASKPDQPGLVTLTEPVVQQIVELSGHTLAAVIDAVLEALRQNGYSAPELHVGRRAPFRLEENTGVRLGLLFLAIRPVIKIQRVEAISRAIRMMSGEELYYWFSKCVHPDRKQADRAQRALRILLAEE
jgi:hypothetical protein